MEKKPVRRKMNQREVEKKINDDTRRKFSYIIPRKGTIEFQPPEETHLNRGLGHDKPFVNVGNDGKFSHDGKVGDLQYYYIPEKSYKALTTILTQFNIPPHMHPDLIWAYLNMVLAASETTPFGFPVSLGIWVFRSFR